jgi:hypothetical protein
MKERISFPGKLRGDGHEAECTVSATKVTLPVRLGFNFLLGLVMRRRRVLRPGHVEVQVVVLRQPLLFGGYALTLVLLIVGLVIPHVCTHGS